jgi:arginase
MTNILHLRPRVSLIGAPTDIGASVRGASMGPEALRVAGIEAALRQRGLEVRDAGNLGGPSNPQAPPQDGYRHLAEVAAWSRAVHDAVHAELEQGQIPILLGGDHCLAIGSISAVARHCREAGRKLRVIWFDAHTDVNTNELTPSGNLHGMPVACLCGMGPSELTGIGGTTPALQPSWISARWASAASTTANGAWCGNWACRSSTCAASMNSACAAAWSRCSRGWTRTRTCT